MDRPPWDRLEGWARAEASRSLDVGLDLQPTLVFFEGERPTLYVRGGARYGPSTPADRALWWNELFGLGMIVHPERAAVLTPTRLRPDSDGSLAGEAEGEMGVLLGWTRRRDGDEAEQGGVVLSYRLDDAGSPHWKDRFELEETAGPLSRHLIATVTGRWGDDRDGRPTLRSTGMTAAGLVYAVTRFGLSVGVDPDWYARYGFDEPIPPSKVRPEDRRRAERRWQARHHRTKVES